MVGQEVVQLVSCGYFEGQIIKKYILLLVAFVAHKSVDIPIGAGNRLQVRLRVLYERL